MTIATKTLAAINAELVRDQGSTFRGLLGKHIGGASDAYSTTESSFRSHLGASIIGKECSREIWYSFHWATKKIHEGRILRLFNRGHLEEPRFIALLEMIGYAVWKTDENGKQFRISGYRGHFGGSIDAVIKGVVEIGDTPVLGEFKTHGDKSFKKLVEEGVMSAKWEHFVQMQTYMGKLNLAYALYLAVNKNDDDIYAEIIQFDKQVYDRYQVRAITIIDTKLAPVRINQSPGWFKCKFCDQRGVCHGTDKPEVNCRTCVHVAVSDNGEWLCNVHKKTLTVEEQVAACPSYVMDPEMKALL